jgi:hypothetical protein
LRKTYLELAKKARGEMEERRKVPRERLHRRKEGLPEGDGGAQGPARRTESDTEARRDGGIE